MWTLKASARHSHAQTKNQGNIGPPYQSIITVTWCCRRHSGCSTMQDHVRTSSAESAAGDNSASLVCADTVEPWLDSLNEQHQLRHARRQGAPAARPHLDAGPGLRLRRQLGTAVSRDCVGGQVWTWDRIGSQQSGGQHSSLTDGQRGAAQVSVDVVCNAADAPTLSTAYLFLKWIAGTLLLYLLACRTAWSWHARCGAAQA